ncbi:hypothetical protein M378DRAFT_12573 [Amanita muscaria Koide BX008]|uniref:Uncharacterized protein n=1 Tax=Amanita muscaria (strain Koide BX008) TaxID=946122 RepID=A0A0C2WMH0_AMAMK|nr:hypothetical protein M378DRAFT_12573 [Amanita muscaria Koide BX008]
MSPTLLAWPFGSQTPILVQTGKQPWGGFSGVLQMASTVKRNQQQYDMPLKILSYDELRQALDHGAATLNVDHVVTGHNADDIAETVINSEFDISEDELLGLSDS